MIIKWPFNSIIFALSWVALIECIRSVWQWTAVAGWTGFRSCIESGYPFYIAVTYAVVLSSVAFINLFKGSKDVGFR